MDSGCPHLSLVSKINREELYKKSESVCSTCKSKDRLWACLQGDCQFIGCGESLYDHSTKHYKTYKHFITVNLVSFRIWCYACQTEVHMPSVFTPAQMKALKKARKQGQDSSPREPNNPGISSTTQPKETDRVEYGSSIEADMQEETVGIPLGLSGLRNMGNTCYMNSAVQAISNCSPLTKYFLNNEDECYQVEKKPSMAKQYAKLMNDMWNPRRLPCIAPNGVHSVLRTINPAFRGYHQQDAQEFLRCLMDRLHEELKTPIPKWIEEANSNGHLDSTLDDSDKQMDTEEQVSDNHTMDHGPATGDTLKRDSEDQDATIEDHPGINSFYPKIYDSESPTRSPASVPSVSAAAAQTKRASYENLSQLHGHDATTKTESQAMHNGSSWPNLSSRSQYGRSSGHADSVNEMKQKPSARRKKSTQHYRSIISEIFDGELRSSVQCLTCDQVSHMRETFQDLSLPIPGKDDLARLHGTSSYYPASGSSVLPVVPGFKGGPCYESYVPSYFWNTAWNFWEWITSWFWGPQVTLNDCLSAFFSADELKGDNMYSCGKCNKLRNGVKYCKLLQLPEVLCVHLKRFRHEYLMSYSSKISSPVSFPIKGLDLRQFLAQDSPSTCTKYDLCSVIVHLGNAGGGHYTAYAKNFMNKKWYEFDDQFVTQVSESVVANAEAYVLFYCKSSVESSRARDRLMALYQEQHQDINLSHDYRLFQFYISLRWLQKFMTFAEPGPIDNSDFVCRHSDILPQCYGILEHLATPVTESFWVEMHAKFGGGPAVTDPKPCSICEEEYFELEERRSHEKETFLQLNQIDRDLETFDGRYYVNMEWFREWEEFLNRRLPEPPGEIDNRAICFTRDGEYFLHKNSSYCPISKKAWLFLVSTYGGGPPVRLRVPKVSKSTSPNRSTGKHRKVKTTKPRTESEQADETQQENQKSNEKKEVTEVSNNSTSLTLEQDATVAEVKNVKALCDAEDDV